jgi:AICAR transformylase/IMP cyclohydrolase PurH
VIKVIPEDFVVEDPSRLASMISIQSKTFAKKAYKVYKHTTHYDKIIEDLKREHKKHPAPSGSPAKCPNKKFEFSTGKKHGTQMKFEVDIKSLCV